MADIAVVGTGYVGLVTGACLADLGHNVTCVDVNLQRIQDLKAGKVPFHEPGLPEVVQRNTSAKRLAFGTDLAASAKAAAVAIIAVGTPSKPDGSADLSFVMQAARDVAASAAKGLALILRSTVPPGTGDQVQDLLRSQGRNDIEVVNAPEFLAEGTAVKDFQHPDRLVFGGSPAAAQAVSRLWDGIRPEAKRHIVDRRTAELCKYAANTFLAARVSLINEVANLCDAVGADVRAVSEIVGQDTRIGAKFLRPGIGYGGSCFPKDVQAITTVAKSVGLRMPVAEATEATNNEQWRKVHAKALRILGDVKGKTVAILGIAFKPETDDTRYAPGLKLAKALADAGANVRMHDPVAKLPADLAPVRQVQDAAEAIAGADLVVQATEWNQYKALDWKGLAKQARQAVAIDARNTLPWDDMAKAGWRVEGVGARPSKVHA
jgi:UDPglucose 6-dehydrogenase